jgi:hypothetical protein
MAFLKLERDAKIPIKPNAAAIKSQPLTIALRPKDEEMPSFPPIVS